MFWNEIFWIGAKPLLAGKRHYQIRYDRSTSIRISYQCCLCTPCMMLLTVIFPHGKRGVPPCPACQRVHHPVQRCGARGAGNETSAAAAASGSDSRLWHTPRWCADGARQRMARAGFIPRAGGGCWGTDALADAFPLPTTQRGSEARAPRSLRDVLAGFITTCTEAPETTQHADK
jgi:hypothetical protein